METKYENIILNKEFTQLTPKELEAMHELFQTEEEFNHLKEVFLHLEKIKSVNIEPNLQTKERLDHLFAQTYPKTHTVWYNSVFSALYPTEKTFPRRPLIQIAAVCLLFLLLFPLVTRIRDLNSQKQLAVNTEVKVETGTEELFREKATEDLEIDADKFSFTKNLEVPEVNTEQNGKKMQTVTDELLIDTRAKGEAVSSDINLTATMAAFEHPDGIFKESVAPAKYSIELTEQIEVLDLLTTAY